MKLIWFNPLFFLVHFSFGQTSSLTFSSQYYEIIDSVSADRLEEDIATLAGFGTWNTLSDTTSETRGIGAARRWIQQEFQNISDQCGGCLDVFEVRELIPAEGNSRIPEDTWVVNIVAIQRGSKYPDRYIIMSGDIDSRNSNASDPTGDAPGANDNATGMASTIEAARVLSEYEFSSNIVYLSSARQLQEWRKESGALEAPINFMPVQSIVPDIRVKGPAAGELLEEIKSLQIAYYLKKV